MTQPVDVEKLVLQLFLDGKERNADGVREHLRQLFGRPEFGDVFNSLYAHRDDADAAFILEHLDVHGDYVALKEQPAARTVGVTAFPDHGFVGIVIPKESFANFPPTADLVMRIKSKEGFRAFIVAAFDAAEQVWPEITKEMDAIENADRK